MFWAFAKGASSSILEDLKARNASEMETKEYEKRLKLQEEIRAAAEEAQRANRVYNQTEDLQRGKLIEMTVGGERRELDLPKEYVQQQQNAIGLQAEKERIDREREEKKFAADLRKADASISASEARAAASRASASLTPYKAAKYTAETEAALRAGTPEGEKPITPSEKRQQEAAVTSVSDSILTRAASLEDKAAATAANKARAAALAIEDPVERLSTLRRIEAKVNSLLNSAPAKTGGSSSVYDMN